MRENRADTALAIVFALLLHTVPLLLLLASAWWRTPPSTAAGEPITADVIDLNALPSSMRSALSRPPEPPVTPLEPLEEALPEEALPDALPEPPPEQQLQPQEQLPNPDQIDQQVVKPDSTSADTAAREQEAKQRQAQVDLTERERQQQAQQKARTEMEEERQRQLDDIRRQRAQAQKQAELSEERLRQLAERRAQQASAAASPPPGNRGDEVDLTAAYAQALGDAIRSNWTQPDNVSPAQICRITIRQLPGGEVIDAQVDPSCPYDEQGRRSVEAAVLKAQPLPYRGFESAFRRTLTLKFRAQDR